MAALNQLGGCGCDRNTSAAFHYDYCFLRYSNIPFFGIPEMKVVATLSSKTNASDNPVFGNRVHGLVKQILPVAATSEFRYAAVAVTNSGFEMNMYGMAWCTMDLRSSDCLKRQNLASLDLPTERTGGEAAMVSCTVRFSTVQFYSTPTMATPPPDSMSPDEWTRTFGTNFHDGNSTSLSSGRKKSSTKTILVGLLFRSLVLIIILTIFLIIKQRMRRKVPIPPLIISRNPLSASRHSKDSLMKNIESLLLDLEATRATTRGGATLGAQGARAPTGPPHTRYANPISKPSQVAALALLPSVSYFKLPPPPLSFPPASSSTLSPSSPVFSAPTSSSAMPLSTSMPAVAVFSAPVSSFSQPRSSTQPPGTYS